MSLATEGPFFDQLGITKVVWLDDLFDIRATPTETDIVEQVATAISAGTLVSYGKLEDLSEEDSASEWARRIQERMGATEIAEFLDAIKPSGGEEASKQLDYTPGELASVVSSLSSSVEKIGLGRWGELKERLIGESAHGVFLVDRERLINGHATNVGDDIVKEVVERCSADVLVVVLTHSVGPAEAETLRQSLAAELAVSPSRLGVVSKRPEGDASLANGVRSAVRITLTQLTCANVTARIAKVMRASLDSTEAELSNLAVGSLDRAVFENSFTEGASEIDVLSRILSSRQRTEVAAHIAGALDDIHSPLARMRKLRLLEPLPALPPDKSGLLQKWRRDEVFDSGENLNSLRAPLSCGDVFVKDGTQNYYMLLGQPCDLTVRPNGQRSAREAMLVKVLLTYAPEGRAEGRYFEVPPLEGTGRWALDFRDWVSIDLDCLEWTSFNIDGRVAFSPGAKLPSGLLPGWELRFERASKKFNAEKAYCLSLGDLPGKVAKASAAGVSFPYRRVARLRGPREAGAYAAFASFHARSAFDHDFAKGVEEGKAAEKGVHGDVAARPAAK